MALSRRRSGVFPAVLFALCASASAAPASPQLTADEARFVATASRCQQFLGTDEMGDTVDVPYMEQLVRALGDGDTDASLTRITGACLAKLADLPPDPQAVARVEARQH